VHVESGGLDGGELRDLLRIVTQRREVLGKAWNDHFGI
jgi:hypothetical protein